MERGRIEYVVLELFIFNMVPYDSAAHTLPRRYREGTERTGER